MAEHGTFSRRKVYTRCGDLGETGLLSGLRVAKDQVRITVCGEIDELSSVLGVVRAEGLAPRHADTILRIQRELIEFGAEVVCPSPVRFGVRMIDRDHIRKLEGEIDEIEAFLPPLTHFVIPGGNRSSAYLHWARTVCRRAERSLVTLARKEPEISPMLLSYLNRLSDLLFVMARREEAV